MADQILEVVDDIVRLEYQHIAFQRIQHHFGGIAHQRAGEARACHCADDRDDGLELMTDPGDQRIGRTLLDVQLCVRNIELLRKRLQASR